MYHDHGAEPTNEDVERSQMLEAKLREGFVRMGELLDMTMHEIVRFHERHPITYNHGKTSITLNSANLTF